MADVASYHEWLMKEDILGFSRRYLVQFPVLVGVGLVPGKPGTVLQRIG
jgi:hypothetical protein